jgi:hypothetical protein
MSMAKGGLSFARRAAAGSRVVRVVFRVLAIVALLYVAIGIWSGYRALVQVRRLDLQLLSPNLRPGVLADVHVVTSGRTQVEVRLELVQGTHSELLADLRVAPSRNGFYDPRTRQGTMTPSFTTEFLAYFQPGPAIVRATALGRLQWLRTPPPVMQEIPVVVASPQH